MALSLSALHGKLENLRFPRILATLAHDGFTGVIQVTTPAGEAAPGDPEDRRPTTTREVHLSDGHVAWAISTDRQESLRAFLERDRRISDSQWSAAEERAREGSLREALTAMGLVKASELSEIEAARAEAIVMELFSTIEGEYRVRERQLSPGTPDLEIAVLPLLLRGIPERADRDFLLDEIGSLDAIFAPRKEALERADLPGEYASLLKQLDGRRSIAIICSQTGLPDNFALSLVAGLSLAGYLERTEGAPAVIDETRGVEEEEPTLELIRDEEETIEEEESIGGVSPPRAGSEEPEARSRR